MDVSEINENEMHFRYQVNKKRWRWSIFGKKISAVTENIDFLKRKSKFRVCSGSTILANNEISENKEFYDFRGLFKILWIFKNS